MIPPGLLGFQMARQQQAQEQSQGLNQLQGLLGIQQAQQQQGLLAQQMQDKQRQQMQIENFAKQLPESDRAAFMVNPNAYIQEMNKKYVVGGSLVSGRGGAPLYEAPRKMEFVNGIAVDPYKTPPGSVLPQDPNKPFSLGPDLKPVPNVPFQNFEFGKASRGAPKTDVRVAMPVGEDSYVKNRLGGEVKTMEELTKRAESAYNQVKTLDRFVEASQKGFDGGAAPIFAGVNNFLASFGINSGAKSLKDYRLMEQAIGDILGNKMAELGARGLTDKDMQILRDALPRAETDRASRLEIARILRRSHLGTLEQYKSAREQEAKNFPSLGNRVMVQPWYQEYTQNPDKFKADAPDPLGLRQ